jgi:hypothetical protein
MTMVVCAPSVKLTMINWKNCWRNKFQATLLNIYTIGFLHVILVLGLVLCVVACEFVVVLFVCLLCLWWLCPSFVLNVYVRYVCVFYVCVNLSVCLCLYEFVFVWICLLYLCLCESIYISICLSIYLNLFESMFMYICVWIWVYVYVYLNLCLCVLVCIYVYLSMLCLESLVWVLCFYVIGVLNLFWNIYASYVYVCYGLRVICFVSLCLMSPFTIYR